MQSPTMEPSISVRNPLLLLLSSFSYILASAAAVKDKNPALTYHDGPLLKGDVNLALLWYGQFGREPKSVIRKFVRSLNNEGDGNLQPQVASWWRTVESYGTTGNGRGAKPGGVHVKVVKQVSDKSYSVGKVITKDFIPGLVEKASEGDPRVIPVIFTGRMVTVVGLCMGKCALHGVAGKENKPYIVVMNPETECPGACAWPFHKADGGPQGVTLQPQSGSIGTEAMLISFASALAGTVTNPFNTGYFEGEPTEPLEAGTACAGIFGSGALPGYTGKVLLDPRTGGAFNAYGVRGKKFLLPGVWNPATGTCWTTM